MSLDVYLTLKDNQVPRPDKKIFVRESGQTKEISRAEWDAKNPGREPVTLESDDDSDEVYSANITHNLGKMADEAGLYKYLWRPEEVGVTHARQLIDPLTDGLRGLHNDPPKFWKHNPENGWGDYAGFVRFVDAYLEACKQYPDAEVSVSR
jgi:hypothetical protein